MDQSPPSSTPGTIITTVMQQSVDLPSESVHRFKDLSGSQTIGPISSIPQTPSSDGSGFFIHDQSVYKIPDDDEPPSSSSLPTAFSAIDMQQSAHTPSKSTNVFKRMISRLPSLSISPAPLTASISGGRFFSDFAARSMTRREIAEIQLYALINDPEESLPTFVRGVCSMSLEEVSKQLNTPPFILERLLNVLESLSGNNGNSSLMCQNNVIRLTRVLNSTMDVRALLFFMMLDNDSDNHVTRNELSQFLELYFKSISFDTNRLQEAVQILLQKFHLQTKTRIDFEEFHSIVIGDATILGSFSRFTVHPTWFRNLVPPTTQSNLIQRICANLCWYQTFYDNHKSKLTPEYLNTNRARVTLLILYILVNLALIFYVVIYRSVIVKSNVFLVFARTSGMLINFNCALIVVLMLKQTILFIRSNELLRRFIPVDDHIDYHKFVGRFIAVLAILHTIAHMVNFTRRQDHSWTTFMFTTLPGIGWIGGFASLSGLILGIVLATMIICSTEWIRRKGHFEVFHWSHLLYLVFFVLLIIHAKDFWKWIIGPLSWFFLEKFYSTLTRYSSSNGRTYLHSATIEQSNVISLNIHRPKNFTFKPGDYININLPRVALYEFHPFTISSAPEETDILRVHIQACGNWTKRVYQRFKRMSEDNDGHEDHVNVYRADVNPVRAAAEERNERNTTENEINQCNINNAKTKKEVIIINGPYSSCARYIFDCKHVVLIAGGIGVTPYASILSSLMVQFRASRTTCQHCQGINYNRKVFVENRRLRKVDFIWVSRDQKSFEWFLNLLRQFEQEQDSYLASNPDEHRFLTIHLYFTEIKDNEDIGHYPLELISQVWAQVAGGDIFTGLKARTHIGRPKWDNIFTEFNSGDDHSTANDVNVFFCGPSAMGKTIQESCTKHNFRFYEEKF